MITDLKIIVFDAYGTLFDVHSIDRLLIDTYGEQGKDISLIWRRKQLEYTWLRTLMGKYVDFASITEETLHFALQSHQIAANDKQIDRILEQYMILDTFPEVKECLLNLGQLYPLGILSNANQRMLRSAATYNDIEERFEHIISADEIGQFKPVPEVYQLITKKTAIEKINILFVSSNTWDIAGASAYGLNTCWLNRSGNLPETMNFSHDLEIKSLADLSKNL